MCFVNVDKVWFLIPKKSLVDGLLVLGNGEETPYSAMAAILNVHNRSHIYVEHVADEFTREGVEHPVGMEFKEEEVVVEVDWLLDDDDEE